MTNGWSFCLNRNVSWLMLLQLGPMKRQNNLPVMNQMLMD